MHPRRRRPVEEEAFRAPNQEVGSRSLPLDFVTKVCAKRMTFCSQTPAFQYLQLGTFDLITSLCHPVIFVVSLLVPAVRYCHQMLNTCHLGEAGFELYARVSDHSGLALFWLLISSSAVSDYRHHSSDHSVAGQKFPLRT